MDNQKFENPAPLVAVNNVLMDIGEELHYWWPGDEGGPGDPGADSTPGELQRRLVQLVAETMQAVASSMTDALVAGGPDMAGMVVALREWATKLDPQSVRQYQPLSEGDIDD